jgi:CelD/BcsL family acetyltransferase involved in cellulose biosynthesis
MPGQDLVVTAVESSEALEAIRDEWLELYARAPGRMAAQHPAYLDAARAVAPPGRRFTAITVRRGGALIALWPLAISTVLGCRVADHPGIGGNEDYAGMLIAPEANPADAIASAIDEVRKHADLVEVYHLLAHHPLLEALRQSAMASRTSSVVAYVADTANAGSLESWLETKGANFRQQLGRQRRKLAKLGAMESVQDEPAILPWFFRAKRKWLEKAGTLNDWLSDPSLWERSFNALAAQPDSPLKTFAIKVNGEYVAAVICLISGDRLEYTSPTYETDGEWERYSPGMLATEDCARWAVEHGLDLDFRFMNVPYKQRWMSRTDRFVTVRAALSPKGVIKLYADTAYRHTRRAKKRAVKTVRDYAAKLRTRLGAGKG